MKKLKKKEIKRDKTNIVDSFPIKKFLNNNLVETYEGHYSISLAVNDIDYQLSSEDKKMDVYMDYCNFLNSIDHTTTIQLTIQKKKRSMEEYTNTIFYEYKEDRYNLYRKELNNLMIDKVSEDRNGFNKSIIFTFSQKNGDANQAFKELGSLADRFKMFCRRVGTTATILNTEDRKEIIGNVLNNNDKQDISETSNESYVPKFIDFKSNSRCIDADGLMCQSLYFKEYPSELSDTFLSDMMEVPGEFTFSLFLKSMNPPDAFDLVRTKLAFMEQQKVDEQKKH